MFLRKITDLVFLLQNAVVIFSLDVLYSEAIKELDNGKFYDNEYRKQNINNGTRLG